MKLLRTAAILSLLFAVSFSLSTPLARADGESCNTQVNNCGSLELCATSGLCHSSDTSCGTCGLNTQCQSGTCVAFTPASTQGSVVTCAAGFTLDSATNTCVPTPTPTPNPAQTNGLPGTTGSGSSGTTGSTGTTGGSSGVNLTQLTNFKNGTLTFINTIAVPILIAIAFIVFLWGVAKAYIISGASEEARKQGHQIILWGVIGFVVVFSLWGIVNLALSIFGVTAGGSAASQNLAPPTL